MYQLYGDGVHDDTNAIQEMIDSGVCEVFLPAPKAFYLISRPLELPSDFRLVLPRFAEVRLSKGANCVMIKNRLLPDTSIKLPEGEDGWHFHEYAKMYESSEFSRNIELIGGIWNCNNMEQNPNPIQTGDTSIREFWGYGMLFFKVNGLKLSCLTIKDPTNFGVNFDTVTHVTAEDITFDYNLGNPLPINMDGLHFNGNCHFCYIRNLHGACYDDLVALNAEEGTKGPITNILIDGIFADDCHSAVRLLTVDQTVENIHISNVYGTYYQYCIGITKYYQGERHGTYSGIRFDNIYASKATRYDYIYPWPDSYVFPLIYISPDTYVKDLTVVALRRKEKNNPICTLGVNPNSVIERLIIEDVVSENLTDSPMPFLINDGTIHEVSFRNILTNGDELIINNNIIENVKKYN